MSSGKPRPSRFVVPSEPLLERLRAELCSREGVTEMPMFGGHCFFYRGNMIGGVTSEDELVVRVGQIAYEQALADPYARPMDLTGRPMRGFVFVHSRGVRTAVQLKRWAKLGLDHARSLPSK